VGIDRYRSPVPGLEVSALAVPGMLVEIEAVVDLSG
jgi:hypothetical protein